MVRREGEAAGRWERKWQGERTGRAEILPLRVTHLGGSDVTETKACKCLVVETGVLERTRKAQTEL